MEALRCPPDDADVPPLGRRAPPRRALQAAARSARHAAARRADQPPRRRNHRLAATAPDRLQGHDPDRHPRPLFPRRHHRLDPRARPRPRHPLRGQLFRLAGAEGQAARRRRRARTSPQKTLERELEWMRQGAKARQAKSKARINAYNELASQSEREKITRAQIVIPNGPRLGGKVIEVDGLRKAMGDKLLIEGPDLLAAARRHRRRDRPQRRGQIHAVPMLTGQEQPDAGTIESATRCSCPMSTSPATRSTPTRPCGRRSPAAPR
jgi:hypothetical protein